VRALDPAQPIGEVRTLSGIASDAVAEPRLNMRLMIGFGGVGLALAAVGIYGLLAFVVTMRRREIAIRIALGARPRDVSSLILGETARLTAAGLAAGLAGAFALGPLLRERHRCGGARRRAPDAGRRGPGGHAVARASRSPGESGRGPERE
jgi:putative ABC transport system permease protein